MMLRVLEIATILSVNLGTYNVSHWVKQMVSTSYVAFAVSSADASVLRSGSEISSRKQRTSSPMGSSPLRRSDRGKKVVKIPDLPNIKSTKEKTVSNSKQCSEDVNEDKKTEKQDPDVGGRKRKKFTAIRYKALFKPQRQRQRQRIESDVEKKIGGTVSPSNENIANTTPEGVTLEIKKHQHMLNVDASENHEYDENVSMKGEEAIENINRERDEKRVSLENDYKVEKSLIHVLYSNRSIRSEKVKLLEIEFANKLEEHESLWEIRLEDLKATMLAAEEQVAADDEFSFRGSQHETQVVHSGEPEVAPTFPENPIEGANDIASTDSHTSEKEMVDATVSSEQNGEVPAQQLGDDMEVDVAEKVDSSHENVMAPHVNCGEMEMPAGNYNKENDEDDTLGLDTSHVDAVAPEVESAEMGMPAGTCDKENAEYGEINPHTPAAGHDHNETSPNDVLPRVESAEMATPADNDANGENMEENLVPAAETPHEEHQPGVATSVAPAPPANALNRFDNLTNQVSSQTNPLLAEVERLYTVKDNVTKFHQESKQRLNSDCEKEMAEIVAKIPPANALNRFDNLTNQVSSQTNPLLAEVERLYTVKDNVTKFHQESKQRLNSDCEKEMAEIVAKIPPANALTVKDNVTKFHQESKQRLNSDCEKEMAEIVAKIPPANALNRFDNLTNQVSSQTNPLLAEVERLYTVKDNVTKFHQESKQRLNSDCEKEMAEIVAKISLKYEAKHQEADAAYNTKKMELETNINRVIMNGILAEAFRSKCQDLTPVSEAGLMQQLCMLSVSPSMRLFHGVPLSSPGQSSGNQQPLHPPQSQPQPQPQPPPRPPLQIVHQPAALFSSRPPPPNTMNFWNR
ncbi:hypothetical protein L1987_00531 [Smallanthus sonchifolius]|uniref:Uncharacterized protein n=1 Tax=Smallanthus sonchifolius TaxID=185202 RepID=A0ACB9K2H4_9ASTR|nr:hypothetical protein L1987_00531 [Smallanthus sonchifolius]